MVALGAGVAVFLDFDWLPSNLMTKKITRIKMTATMTIGMSFFGENLALGGLVAGSGG